ncbi:non-ribosomal peptide synthetase [Algicola sagamiensis]|uniref:non-ribosomal peptide synthetase n=1 Tax=Algicola sagamiensis TaxID=163869 RepID=UPI00036D7F73|nr:non-ribosomal peptide synthetase [Algicola sagamiensis]
MRSPIAQYSRPISVNEHLYLASGQAFSGFVIQLMIEGVGNIDEKSMKQAVNLAAERNPGIRLRRAGKYWVSDGPLPQVITEEGQQGTQPEFNPLLQLPHELDPTTGPTCEVRIVRHAPRTWVIFRALHAVMDGQGLLQFAKAVFEALRGEPCSESFSLITDDSGRKLLNTSTKNKTTLKAVHSGPRSQSVDGQFHFAMRQLNLSHPAMIAKLSLGIEAEIMQKDADLGCLMVPVDFRSVLPKHHQQSMANLSLPAFLPLSKGQSWQSRSDTLLKQIQSKSYIAYGESDHWCHTLPHRLLSWVLKKRWLKQMKSGKYMVSSVVSHIGRIYLSQFDTSQFQATRVLSVPCEIPIAPFSIVLVENVHRDDTVTTQLCLITQSAIYADPQALLDRILQSSGFELPRVYSAPSSKVSEKRLGEVKTLHQLFESQVLQTPSQPCLTWQEATLDYATVNQRANQLAHWLRLEGLETGTIVGVNLPRSFEQVIAILATLKAGGIYLPLDPNLPEARLNYLLENSQVEWVFTTQHTLSTNLSLKHPIFINEIKQATQQLPIENIETKWHSDQPCYLLYTSGSTGAPKGVLNTHSGVVNHFLWMKQQLNLGPDDATLQKTPMSFDASLLEIFLPLQCGARVVISHEEKQNDPYHLCDLMVKHQVTFLSIVPSILDSLLDVLEEERLPPLNQFLVGGEAFSTTLYRKIQKQFPHAEIYNFYGPAEAAIDSFVFHCSYPFDTYDVPIGRPIANMEAFVVDHQLQPLPPGEVGELIIAGVGVSAGYWRQSALSAEKFIAHPFHPNSPWKAYRTGDCVKQLPCGNFLFIGRQDGQVKIRGVRIELGEIEHQLEQVPWIKQAVVIAKPSHGQQVLHAYFTTTKDVCTEQEGSLRSLFANDLPPYMIPAAFVRLNQMPLNSSGKVDRKALSIKHSKSTKQTDSSTINSCSLKNSWSAEELRMANIWQRLLKQPIQSDSDFFLLGGNSMLAIRLFTDIESEFGLTLKPSLIFEHSDFAAFAKATGTD